MQIKGLVPDGGDITYFPYSGGYIDTGVRDGNSHQFFLFGNDTLVRLGGTYGKNRNLVQHFLLPITLLGKMLQYLIRLWTKTYEWSIIKNVR